jgi:hypothetical protein
LVLLDGIITPPRLSQSLRTRVKIVSGLQAEAAADLPGPTVLVEPLRNGDVTTLLQTVLPSGFGGATELTAFVMAETDGVARDVIAVTDELTRTPDLNLPTAFDAVRRAVPYKGLQVFDDGDAVRFHGRERAVDDVVDALTRSPFVAVVGSSGSGKSSVIRAGCLPKLAAAGDTVVVMSSGEDPLRALRVVVAGGNATVVVVELDPSKLVAMACTTSGRNLTRAEFVKYLGSGPYHRTCPQWSAGT